MQERNISGKQIKRQRVADKDNAHMATAKHIKEQTFNEEAEEHRRFAQSLEEGNVPEHEGEPHT